MACIDVIEQENRFTIVGLVGQRHEVGTSVLGYSVLGDDKDLPRLIEDVTNALIAVGQIKSAEIRIRLFNQVRENGGRLPVVTSPRAYVSHHAVIGEGSIVMHGAVVNAGARVGRNCILNSMSLVEHGSEIGDHCHIATAAAVNSGVTVGYGTFIGSSSSIRQCTKVGAHSVIGMGQRVLADCPDGTWLPVPRH
jgi:sugar O-acyltransferase (sialic acid O-acetyltransferase NeuD family)